MRLSLLPLFALLLGGASVAQAIEDPGPHPVGWQDIDVPDPNSAGTLSGRVFYPAATAGQDANPDPTGGPFPLVGFMHGWISTPSVYDDICTHVASWGFFVASIGTETGFFGTMQNEARDTAAYMRDFDAKSQTPGSPFHGMISGDDWSAFGHSMGGGALFYLIAEEPKVRVLVPLQPYKGDSLGGSDGSQPNVESFTGDIFFVAGEVDTTTPPAQTSQLYFADLGASSRNLYAEVLGMGHGGPTDFPPTNEPLAASEQARMHRLLVAGALRAEIKGEENLYFELIGEGATVEPLELESACQDAPLWGETSVQQPSLALALGAGGSASDTLLLAGSFGTLAFPTAFGVLGLDPSPAAGFRIFTTTVLSATGLEEIAVPIPPGLSGTSIYLQGLLVDGLGGRLTRTSTYVVP